ncbi:MAG: hypothetical protein ACI9RL_001686 [Candidatus Paceibacteria bacterium]
MSSGAPVIELSINPIISINFVIMEINNNNASNGTFFAIGVYNNIIDTWINATSKTEVNLKLGQGYQMATTSGGILFFTGIIASGDQT